MFFFPKNTVTEKLLGACGLFFSDPSQKPRTGPTNVSNERAGKEPAPAGLRDFGNLLSLILV